MRRFRLALVVAGLALGIAAEWVSYSSGELDRALADLLDGWVLVGCGVVAAQRRGDERVAALMAATGVAWLAGSLVRRRSTCIAGRSCTCCSRIRAVACRAARSQARWGAAYVDGAIEPLGQSAVRHARACAALVAVAAIAGYLCETGPRRRARAAPTVGAAAVAAVLGFGALAAAGRVGQPRARRCWRTSACWWRRASACWPTCCGRAGRRRRSPGWSSTSAGCGNR